mmetsp:Transcript_20635/g.25521  ORF Transcript_20635/g.25521 Transcript_20635/m.25521 type:complete len:83 (+) Transcript_20635:1627-1875(+)
MSGRKFYTLKLLLLRLAPPVPFMALCCYDLFQGYKRLGLESSQKSMIKISSNLPKILKPRLQQLKNFNITTIQPFWTVMNNK